MPHNSSQEFDFVFDPDGFDYDPLADFDDGEDSFGQASNQSELESNHRSTPLQTEKESPVDIRPASERIEELFKDMATRRRVLLALMRFLQEPQSADSFKDEVDRLQQHDYSVFTSANYARLMDEAGAIKKVNADGSSFEDVEIQPEVVVVDGVEYLKPADIRQVYWLTTEDGQAYLDTDKPLERLYNLLEEEKSYAAIYKRVLKACAAENGMAIAALTAMIDKDPLVQQPRKRAPHFVHRLEECEALRWEGRWRTTEIGKLGLERLADTVDENAPSETEASAAPESEE